MQHRKKVAFITGACGAIGAAVAQRLRGAGYELALADLRMEQGDCPVPGALALTLDVRETRQVAECIARITETYGAIDALVNVAGVTSTGSALDITEDEWARVLDINLSGTFRCCQAVIPLMRQAGRGRIVNLGSVLGKNGGNARPWLRPEEQASSGNAAYGVSKAGVHALTAYLAKELARDGITVNAVAPGPVASSMTTGLAGSITQAVPVGRMGRPDEVAAAVAFLLSDESAYLTGEVLDLNGGLWCD